MLLDSMQAQLVQRLGAVVYGVDDDTLASVVIRALRQRGWSIAIGETGTGGGIARRLLEVEGGAQAVRKASVGLDALSLAREAGATPGESDDASARAIACALREHSGADVGLAIVQGSGPVPYLHLALATGDGVQSRQWPSRGRSDYAMAWTVNSALDAVRLALPSGQ